MKDNSIDDIEQAKSIEKLKNLNNTFEEANDEPEDPYTRVLNSLIRDESISPECRWLIIYLLSNKPGWVINLKQLIAHLKPTTGRDKVYKIVNEAIEAGYILKVVTKKGNLISHTRYFVSRIPKFKKCFRHPDFQDTENQDTEALEKTTPAKIIYKKNIYKKKREREKETAQAPPPPISKDVKISFGQYIRLFQKDYEALCNEYTKALIDKYIEKMNLYLASSHTKPYKDYLLKLRAWIVEDLDKHKDKTRSFNGESLNGQINDCVTTEEISEHKRKTRAAKVKYHALMSSKRLKLCDSLHSVHILDLNKDFTTKPIYFNDREFVKKLQMLLREYKIINE